MLPRFYNLPLMCPPIKAELTCLAWHQGPREQLQPPASQSNPWLTTSNLGQKGGFRERVRRNLQHQEHFWPIPFVDERMVWISLPPRCVPDYISLRPNRILIALTKRQGGDGHGTLYLISASALPSILRQFGTQKEIPGSGLSCRPLQAISSQETQKWGFFQPCMWECEQKFMSCTTGDSGRSWSAFQALLAQGLTYPWSILPPTVRQENNRGIMRAGWALLGNSACISYPVLEA